MNIQIKPQIGIGDVLLGMTKFEINGILGKPKFKNLDRKNGFETWSYWNDALDFDFDKEDNGLLSKITIRDVDAEFNNCKLIGISESELLKVMPDIVLEDDFEENGKDYYDNNIDLSFWVSDGRVENITIFPKYTADGETPIWPE